MIMELFSTLFANLFVFVFGAAIGSFLNVLSDRLPNDESILGRSHCEKCKHELAWYDLFPLLSFLFLKGKCRYCKTKLSFYYPGVEVATGLMFVLTWNFMPTLIPVDSDLTFYLSKALAFVVVTALLVIFFADLKYQIIPDSMHVVLLICGVIIHLIRVESNYGQFLSIIIHGLIVMLPILLLFLVTRGRGMGFGDVKLAFVIGVLFGIKLGFIMLYLSFIFGSLVGGYLILTRKKKFKSKIAFGPFIVLAMFAGLFFREPLLRLMYSIWGI